MLTRWPSGGARGYQAAPGGAKSAGAFEGDRLRRSRRRLSVI